MIALANRLLSTDKVQYRGADTGRNVVEITRNIPYIGRGYDGGDILQLPADTSLLLLDSVSFVVAILYFVGFLSPSPHN